MPLFPRYKLLNILQINEYITTKCLPNLRRFLVDNDKVTTLCSNMVYYIINPAMKARSMYGGIFEQFASILICFMIVQQEP
jgi:hypothetical protein